MKKYLLLFIGLIVSLTTFAQVQDWGWAQAGSGTLDENSNHIAIDNSGNLIITGKFASPTATLSTVTLTNTGASGTSEFLIAKYNQSGVLQWAKRAQGMDNDEGIAVTTDGSGNIYATGVYESPTITFGTITLTNSSTFQDVFVVKYDGSGNVLWANTYGGTLLEEVRSIKADNSGNTYLAGSFRSLAVQFGSFGVINAGNADAFLTKLDVNGVAQWAKQIGGAQNDNGLAVTHDGAGNIYMAGEFNSPNLTTYNLNNAGGVDIFLSKYDAGGNLLTTKVIGGSLNETAYYLVTDASGNLYMAASYESTTLSLVTVTLTNASTRDMALIKMNSALVVQWAKRVSGNLNSNPTALFIDQSANLFMTGSYDLANLNFGTQIVTNASSALEGFIVKYDLTGTDLWAKGTNAASDQELRGIVVDANGSIYVTGHYTSTLTLGSTALANAGVEDLFISKICMQPSAPTAATNLTVCPKKGGVLSVTPASGTSINWYAAATGGTPLVIGNNTFSANTTSTVFAEALNPTTGCVNPARLAVSLFVQPGSLVTVSGKTLTASSGTVFKWIECQKDSILAGQNAQTYVIVKTGSYAAIVTNNGCTDTTACKFYSVSPSGTVTLPNDTVVVGITKVQKDEMDILIYPNPSNGDLTIKSDHTTQILLINIFGQVLKNISFTAENNFTNSVQGLESGIYFLQGETRIPQRIVVNR